MWKIIRLAMAYKHLMPEMIALVQLIQTTGMDGKLTKGERGQLISAFSKFITKVGPGQNATTRSTKA